MKLKYIKILKTLFFLIVSCYSYAQSPFIEWQVSLGGTNTDILYSMIQTTDGGYIIAGFSNSNNGDVTGNHGDNDYWIVKLTSTGIIEWQKSFGGTSDDQAYSIIQTIDGGYIVAGSSSSNDGHVTGNHGATDYWIVKLSSLGIIEWQKSLGGISNDVAKSIIQTTDGGYIVAGESSSNNGDVTGNHGATDYWIVKLSSLGIIEWQKSFGGTSNDVLFSMIQTTDGGYIVAGSSSSNDGDVTGNHGFTDYWIVKLSSSGIIEWQKSFGGSLSELALFISQTIDGGYLVAGPSRSNDGDVTSNYGLSDCWILKLNSTGIIEWKKPFGGSSWDNALSIIQTSDGGYIVASHTSSNNGDVTGNHGQSDYWIVKLSATLSTTSFLENNNLSIFPNPAKENLTIKLDNFTPSQEITITDILGKIIHTQKLDGLTTTINTSKLEKGIYILNLINGTQLTSQKFIKE
ncbi:T9SS type A sorting domain-containing protein [Flavobacterium sp.]|uniref:T9SS type A sorting domain-containing protein n=1 Tax=Flavobacterium sp. TaxID=239 RepID=UPI003F69D35D